MKENGSGLHRPSLVTGIELGPRQFTLAVGQPQSQDPRRLLLHSVESIPAQGFEKEGISDPIECADGIMRLVRQVERSLSCKLSSAMVAFPSNHLKSYNASASIPIPDPGVGISRTDVERAVSTCRTLSLDYDRQILHAFERGFTVDNQSGVKNPVGLSGKKLSVELHLVTAVNLAAQNLTRVLNRGGLEVESFILPGLACGEAVLADLDRDLGVTLVRIGDFQTEVVLYDDGRIHETFFIPGGAEDLIEHLSRALRVPRVSAEYLLGQIQSLEENADRASVPLRTGPGLSVKSFPQGEVAQLVRNRARELLQRLRRRLATSSVFLDCASGVVVVGQLARVEGFLEMAEEFFNMPVRLGTVKEVEVAQGVNLRSQDITAVGLVRHSLLRRPGSAGLSAALPLWFRPVEKIQRLLQDYF